MRQKREAAAEQRRGGGESEEDSAVSKQRPEEVLAIEEPCLDYGFFDRVCILYFLPQLLPDFPLTKGLTTTPSKKCVLCSFVEFYLDFGPLNS